MKTVIVTKDAYIDNSVRVNYFDPTAIKKEQRIKSYEATELEDMYEEADVIYNDLLFCERLNWDKKESELDERIENKRLEFENILNG